MSLPGVRLSSTRLSVLCRFVLAWLLVWSGTGAAAPAVLVTVRTIDATDPAPYELRLRSELAAEGIDAVVADPNSMGGNARQFATRIGANAVVEVTVSAGEVTTSVWAADPSLSLEVTRKLRVSNQQRDAVAVFALRTVDFLQGARLELEQQRRAKLAAAASSAASTTGPSSGQTGSPNPPNVATSDPNPEDAVRPKPAKSTRITPSYRVAPPRTRPRPARKSAASDRFRVSLAYAMLIPSDGFGWSMAPALALSWRAKSRWAIGMSVVGPFVNDISTSSRAYGITVDQELLQLELRKCVQLGQALELEPYLGMGSSRYAANGNTDNPQLVGHLATAWSLFAVAGGSLVYHLGSHLHLVGDVAGFGRWQAPRVEVDGDQLTGRSRWNLLLKAGPGWSF